MISSRGDVMITGAGRQTSGEPTFECFWIKHEQSMRGRKKWTASDDPPPDLAVEIGITSSWLDRLEIYAALKVPEVWCYDGESLKVLVLAANGKFKERAKSLVFPSLPMNGFIGFAKKLGSADEVSLIQDFTTWLRTDVAGKKPNAERKNGHR